MANRIVKPGLRRIIQGFTLQEQMRDVIKAAADSIHISKSEFVEQAILEKIERMEKQSEL
jgi:hypothetical protein